MYAADVTDVQSRKLVPLTQPDSDVRLRKRLLGHADNLFATVCSKFREFLSDVAAQGLKAGDAAFNPSDSQWLQDSQ